MMIVFPLTFSEERAIRWAVRIAPAVAVAIILLVGAMSVASTAA